MDENDKVIATHHLEKGDIFYMSRGTKWDRKDGPQGMLLAYVTHPCFLTTGVRPAEKWPKRKEKLAKLGTFLK